MGAKKMLAATDLKVTKRAKRIQIVAAQVLKTQSDKLTLQKKIAALKNDINEAKQKQDEAKEVGASDAAQKALKDAVDAPTKRLKEGQRKLDKLDKTIKKNQAKKPLVIKALAEAEKEKAARQKKYLSVQAGGNAITAALAKEKVAEIKQKAIQAKARTSARKEAKRIETAAKLVEKQKAEIEKIRNLARIVAEKRKRAKEEAAEQAATLKSETAKEARNKREAKAAKIKEELLAQKEVSNKAAAAKANLTAQEKTTKLKAAQAEARKMKEKSDKAFTKQTATMLAMIGVKEAQAKNKQKIAGKKKLQQETMAITNEKQTKLTAIADKTEKIKNLLVKRQEQEQAFKKQEEDAKRNRQEAADKKKRAVAAQH